MSSPSLGAIPTVAPTFSAEVQALAARGLADLAKASDQPAQRQVGDQYLGKVATEGAATDLEKLVAATAKTACGRRLANSSAVGAQQVALKILAAGVSGPIGVVLGTLGSQVVSRGYDQEDQRAMAPAFLEALKTHGSSSERLLAEAASAASSQRMANSSAVGAQAAAFRLAADGVQGAPEATLAQYGRKALASAYDQEDQRAVGTKVLNVIAQAGGDAVLDALASTANTASAQRMANSTAVGLQSRALEMIAAPPSNDPDSLFASLGKKAAAAAYDQEDARAAVNKILDGLVQHGKNPVAVAVAEVARAATGQRLANSSAVALQGKALDRVVAGVGSDRLEVALSRLGMNARSCGYDNEDAHAMGNVVIDQIGGRTSDPQVQALVRYAQQYAGRGAPDADAVRIQAGIFDSIVKGTMTVPAPPAVSGSLSGGHSTSLSGAAASAQVMLPVVDEKASPDEQFAALEKCVAHNQQVCVDMGTLSRSLAADVATLQTRQQELADRINAMAEAEAPLVKRIQVASRITTPSFLVGMGGLIASTSTHSPIAMAVAAVAGLGYLASTLVRNHAEGKRQGLHGEYQSVKMEHDLTQMRAASLQGEISSAHAVTEQAEKAIKDAQGRLDVHRMARAVNGGIQPDVNARVTVEEHAVTIGGVRIAKKVAVPIEGA